MHRPGALAEWLGTGLQNLVHRFDSGRRLSTDFVAAWFEFADWTLANVEGAGRGTLLRDLADDHFVSVGPWDNLEAIENWRSLPGWSERVGLAAERGPD